MRAGIPDDLLQVAALSCSLSFVGDLFFNDRPSSAGQIAVAETTRPGLQPSQSIPALDVMHSGQACQFDAVRDDA